jgi:hypothetical protein
MAEENPTWSYCHIQEALANLGHRIDAITVRKFRAATIWNLPRNNAERA